MVSGTAPTVSVCIRAHSRPLALQQAIESALAQTFTDFELVISDDSGQMAEVAYASGDSRIRYHQNPTPVGSTTNIRAACSRARGRLIALLDDDDRWLPNFLAVTVDRFEVDPAAGIV